MGLFGRFTSFKSIVAGAKAAATRFPLALLSAITASVTAIVWIEESSGLDDFAGGDVLFAAALGLPLFFAITTFSENRQWSTAKTWLLRGAGVVLLVVYFFTLPGEIGHLYEHPMRWLLLFIGLHFLVAFLPYLRRDEMNGFWQYNKGLFLRFLLAALYSAVLNNGLIIALLAIDHLFGADFDDEIYPQLFFAVAGVFNTWVFLASVPKDLRALNSEETYPTGLKVFTQFILLPLVMIYFVILISYEAKIIIEWDWPRGWVSNLVLWYAVVGILSLLLLHPLQKRSENRWIVIFGRWFFRLLIPLVVMLFFAILERIGDYGVTVNRHLVITMAVGLALVVLYFVFSRRRDIRIIPIVICVLAFLSAYGPLSAFTISERSQTNRLENLMSRHEILVDGLIRPAEQNIPAEDRKQMASIVDYLLDWHGLEPFEKYYSDSAILALDSIQEQYSVRDTITQSMGFSYYTARTIDPEFNNRFNLHVEDHPDRSFDVSDFDYFLTYRTSDGKDTSQTFGFDGDTCRVRFDGDSLGIMVGASDVSKEVSDSLWLSLDDQVRDVVHSQIIGNVDPEQLVFEGANDRLRVRLYIDSFQGTYSGDSISVSLFHARILVGVRE